MFLFLLFTPKSQTLTEENNEQSTKQRQKDEMRKMYIRKKGQDTARMKVRERLSQKKTDASVKQLWKESFFLKTHLREERLLEKLESGSLFGFVSCNFQIPAHLREESANFSFKF